MKQLKNIAVAAAVLGFLAISSLPAFAQTVVTTTNPQTTYVYTAYEPHVWNDRTGRNDFGIQVAGALDGDNVDDSLYLGAAFSHGVNPWLGLGIEGGWQETDFDITDDNDLSIVTVFGDIILRGHVPDWALQPYGVVGLGVLAAYTDTTSDNDDEYAFAAKFGVGLDWFINANWILNFEVAYIATGAEIDAGTTDTSNLDQWRIGAGLKYAF